MNKYKRIGLFATLGVILTAVFAFVGEKLAVRRQKRKDDEELSLLTQENLTEEFESK